MGFLDSLLGLQQLAQAQMHPLTPCVHPNCPECRKDLERFAEQEKQRDEAARIKKEEYAERCKKYMERIHSTRGYCETRRVECGKSNS